MQKDNARTLAIRPTRIKILFFFIRKRKREYKETQSMKNRFGYSLNVLLTDERVDCFHYFNLYPAPYVIKAKIKPWIHKQYTKLKYQQKEVSLFATRIRRFSYLVYIEVHLVDLSYHIRHDWNHRCQTQQLFHLIHGQEMNYWRKLVALMMFQLCYVTPCALVEIIPAFWLLTSQC